MYQFKREGYIPRLRVAQFTKTSTGTASLQSSNVLENVHPQVPDNNPGLNYSTLNLRHGTVQQLQAGYKWSYGIALKVPQTVDDINHYEVFGVARFISATGTPSTDPDTYGQFFISWHPVLSEEEDTVRNGTDKWTALQGERGESGIISTAGPVMLDRPSDFEPQWTETDHYVFGVSLTNASSTQIDFALQMSLSFHRHDGKIKTHDPDR